MDFSVRNPHRFYAGLQIKVCVEKSALIAEDFAEQFAPFSADFYKPADSVFWDTFGFKSLWEYWDIGQEIFLLVMLYKPGVNEPNKENTVCKYIGLNKPGRGCSHWAVPFCYKGPLI